MRKMFIILLIAGILFGGWILIIKSNDPMLISSPIESKNKDKKITVNTGLTDKKENNNKKTADTKELTKPRVNPEEIVNKIDNLSEDDVAKYYRNIEDGINNFTKNEIYEIPFFAERREAAEKKSKELGFGTGDREKAKKNNQAIIKIIFRYTKKGYHAVKDFVYSLSDSNGSDMKDKSNVPVKNSIETKRKSEAINNLKKQKDQE